MSPKLWPLSSNTTSFWEWIQHDSDIDSEYCGRRLFLVINDCYVCVCVESITPGTLDIVAIVPPLANTCGLVLNQCQSVVLSDFPTQPLTLVTHIVARHNPQPHIPVVSPK